MGKGPLAVSFEEYILTRPKKTSAASLLKNALPGWYERIKGASCGASSGGSDAGRPQEAQEELKDIKKLLKRLTDRVAVLEEQMSRHRQQ